MPLDIQPEPDNIYVLRLSGVLKRSEFGTLQDNAARDIDAGAQPRILAVLDDFRGWERGADWNDLDFQLTHGKDIAKIAIVGDPRWEAEALAFSGAGFRRAPVKFFPAGELPQARAWLTS
jgi:hypothetical protein